MARVKGPHKQSIGRLVATVAGVLAAVLIAVPAAWAATPFTDIHSAGPLSDIYIGNDLGCQVRSGGFSTTEYFPNAASPGDCGTFVNTGSDDDTEELEGPDFSNHAGGTHTNFTIAEVPFTPVSQTLTGLGTAANPYQVTTVVTSSDPDPSGPIVYQLTEVDSYVVGNDFYRTDVTVKNTGSSSTGALQTLYHAADCQLRGSDNGFGVDEPLFGATVTGVACTTSSTSDAVREQLVPITPSSPTFTETTVPLIWNDLSNSMFPAPTCCTSNTDNATGIGWTFDGLAPGASQAFSWDTVISDTAAVGGFSFSGVAGSSVGGTVATIADPNTSATASAYSATINWGDGTSSAGTVSGSGGNFTVTGNHSYAAAGTYPISVAISSVGTNLGTSTVTDSATIAPPPPTVTGVSPSFGPLTAGTRVTITGTNLTSATAVRFGTATATINADTATSITATAPAGTAGTVDVTVTTAGGTSATSAADHYTYVAAPTVTSVSPTAGPTTGGTSVTITGTAFTNATAVKFGATNATTFTVNSATSITAIAPAEAAATVDVTVTTVGGTSATSAADHYAYVTGPAVTGINPPAGPTAGGTSVTITGANFTGATAVRFGTTNATTFTVSSATSITATAPAHTAGIVDVAVTTAGGTSPTSPTDQYAYLGIPTVTGVSPTSGPAAGGTTVTITGTNLADPPEVDFGNTPATVVTDSLTSITATAPAGSPGTVDVTVKTPGGTSAASPADHYTYNAPTPAASPGAGPAVAAPPAVAGGSPTTETSNGGTASGTVNPEGQPTTAFFQYGLDPSYRGPGADTTLYDQSTPVQSVGSDATVHTVSAALTGLVPGALYHIRLVATNSTGTSFGPDLTFTTPAAPPPPKPVLGHSQNVQPVSGVVYIRLPSGQFVKLTGNEQIPNGAEIDALHGSLKITTATAKKGKTQQGVFGGAVFKLTQAASGPSKGLVTLSIVEGAFTGAPSYATCKAHKAHKALDATAASSKTLQLLHASAKGKFRTKGKYSAATVLGTIWTVADRCDGTLTHDVTDSVSVNDFVHHKTIILHAGQSYLAKRP